MRFFCLLTLSICLFSSNAYCMKSKTNNTKPTLKFEKGSIQVEDQTSFEIELVNFPKKKKYILASRRPLLGETDFTNLQQIKIEEDQSLLIKDFGSNQESKQTKFNQLPMGFATGERVEYRIITPRKNLITESSYIPKPIRKESKKGTFKVNAELVTNNPTTYLIKFEGIGKKEMIQMTSRSGDSYVDTEVQEAGRNPITYCPAVEGLNGGQTQIAFARDSGDLVTLTLNWGEEVINEIKSDQERYWKNHNSTIHVVNQ